MKKTKTSSNKILKKGMTAFAAYYITGLIVGFVSLQIRCQNSMFSCWSLGQYLSDPWLFVNTLVWPITFYDILNKASILF